MAYSAIDVLQTLPPRPLSPDERNLLDEWLAASGDIACAFFSERRADDPALYRRIVIYEDVDAGPAYLVHAPLSIDAWIMMNVHDAAGAQSFTTLRQALNSIRPVFAQ
jgi:hypothetical protein